MHDGSLASLEKVVDFYNRGGRPNPLLDTELRPLALTVPEKRQIVAFLRALSGVITR
jgi:cytochrome c peroxidase